MTARKLTPGARKKAARLKKAASVKNRAGRKKAARNRDATGTKGTQPGRNRDTEQNAEVKNRASPAPKNGAKLAKRRITPVSQGRKKAAAKRIFSPEFLANQFQPGESGNPEGRPKSKSTAELWEEWVGGTLRDANGEELTRHEALVQILFSEGVTKRNPRILVAILDRIWPKPIRLEGADGAPLIPPAPAEQEPDLSALTDAELRSLAKIQRKMRAASGGD